jgi:hypothetical protein
MESGSTGQSSTTLSRGGLLRIVLEIYTGGRVTATC